MSISAKKRWKKTNLLKKISQATTLQEKQLTYLHYLISLEL